MHLNPKTVCLLLFDMLIFSGAQFLTSNPIKKMVSILHFLRKMYLSKLNVVMFLTLFSLVLHFCTPLGYSVFHPEEIWGQRFKLGSGLLSSILAKVLFFSHFQSLLFSCIRCSFEQNTRKLFVYLRNESENNIFPFLLFILGTFFVHLQRLNITIFSLDKTLILQKLVVFCFQGVQQ